MKSFVWELDDEDSVTLEKAYLVETNEGYQWWRVAWTAEGERSVFEALIDAEAGTLEKLRAGDSEGRIDDIDVSGDPIYVAPIPLSDEEVAAIGKGNVQVNTPAGRFQAKLLAFNFGDSQGKIEWWQTQKVPGGIVKYQLTDTDGTVVWSASISEYGKKAESELGSF